MEKYGARALVEDKFVTMSMARDKSNRFVAKEFQDELKEHKIFFQVEQPDY